MSNKRSKSDSPLEESLEKRQKSNPTKPQTRSANETLNLSETFFSSLMLYEVLDVKATDEEKSVLADNVKLEDASKNRDHHRDGSEEYSIEVAIDESGSNDEMSEFILNNEILSILNNSHLSQPCTDQNISNTAQNESNTNLQDLVIDVVALDSQNSFSISNSNNNHTNPVIDSSGIAPTDTQSKVQSDNASNADKQTEDSESDESRDVFFDVDNAAFEKEAISERQSSTSESSSLSFSVKNQPDSQDNKHQTTEIILSDHTSSSDDIAPSQETSSASSNDVASEDEESNVDTEGGSEESRIQVVDPSMVAESSLSVEPNQTPDNDLESNTDAPINTTQDEMMLDKESEDESSQEDDDIDLIEPQPVLRINTQVIPVHWEEDMVQSIDITPHRLFEPTKYRPRIVREKTIPILEMWWYDAYEDFSSGTVYLFGKSYNSENTCYESCCVRLQDVQREIYVLPRQYRMDDYGNQTNDKVSLADVENELTSLLQNKGISSFKMETCNRKYAFDSTETPAEASYIRLNYSYIDYELPVTLKGRTFSRVFGANTGPLEHWIIQRHIMGPCWIRVADAMITDATQSWCKLNATTTGIHTCTVAEQQETVPPLTILSLNTVSYRSPNTNSNEIVAVSGFVRKNATIDESDVVPVDATCFTFVRLLPGTEYTEDMIDTCRKTPNHHIFLESTEEALLSGLINTIHRLDPDILVGHDFYGVSLNLLLRRMKHFNVEHWHKIGRIRHQKWPKTISSSSSALLGESSIQERRLMTGRIVCDTLMASRDLIKSKSYDLTELASAQLHIVRCSIEPSQLKKHFSQDSNQLLLLLNHCLYDAFLAYQLMTKMNVLLLTKQLTNISGNLWSHTLYGARLERNEYLLLHTFYQKKFVYPNKRWKEQKTLQFTDEALEYEVSRKKPGNFKSKSYMSLSGGLVLEPKIGLYDDYVLLLDFNSLYPTIMQEFNVCFTNPNLNNYNASSSDESKLGVLPELVKEFVEQRKRVKKLMQNPNLSRSQRAKYEIQQMSLKLTANSMYGSLGSNVSRFESRRLAAIITAKGREVLENTVDLASKLGLDIIYGDTDSVMINTHQKKLMKAKAIGERFKAHINRHHQLLEIDIDSIFRRTLLARKKKYAALAVSERSDGTWQECVQIKGLDLVRRDWCGLSREVSEQVLQLIFQQEDQSTIVSTIHQYLQDVARKMEKKAYTIDSYIIRKQLTKIPQQYMNSKSNYHVTVAKSIRRAGQMVRVGDTVAYVMCRSPNSSVTVPCTPKEVVDGKLEIDIQWYLQKQILPPVYRICQPIDGTDIKQLASQLNVDINDLADSLEDTADNTSVTSWTHKNSNMFLLNDEQCYDMIEPPSFICSYCGHTNAFLGPIQIEDGKMVSGLTCGSCQLVINKASVWCQVRQKLELLVSQYYQRKWICNQEACGFSTRDDVGAYCVVPQCNGRLVPEISDRNFFSKLCYLSKLFDYSKSLEKIPETVEDQVSQYQSDFFEIKQLIDQWIQRSGYRYVDVPWVT